MHAVTPRSLRIHPDGYCSQMRVPPSPIRSLEEGILVIEERLRKTVLCRHDVEDINRTYRAMDLLEKQSAYVEATYYGVSDEVLANLRGKQIQYPKGFKTR